MAPDLPIKIIGVRAGEKLHEVMCPGDNYHLTLEFTDHYVIMPTIEYPHRVDYSCNPLGENGVPVPDGFQYSSDLNTEWITGQQLLEMIG
jgi:UDP-N-acetylglucosamine 4,6-dehydratase